MITVIVLFSPRCHAQNLLPQVAQTMNLNTHGKVPNSGGVPSARAWVQVALGPRKVGLAPRKKGNLLCLNPVTTAPQTAKYESWQVDAKCGDHPSHDGKLRRYHYDPPFGWTVIWATGSVMLQAAYRGTN